MGAAPIIRSGGGKINLISKGHLLGTKYSQVLNKRGGGVLISRGSLKIRDLIGQKQRFILQRLIFFRRN